MTWIYRFQTTRAFDGKRVENTRAIGLVKDIGTSEAAAWREVGRLGLDNHTDRDAGSRPTFRKLAEHFRLHELKKESGIGLKAEDTVGTDELLLDRWILPRWGDREAAEIKPLEIEAWFEALTSQPLGKKGAPLSWGTIAKLKFVMNQVFKHAQRHELIPAAIGEDGRPTNPVVLARSESGTSYEARVVSPEQMIIILHELDTLDTMLEWTLALLHAATGLRPRAEMGEHRLGAGNDQHPERVVKGQENAWEEQGQHDACRNAPRSG